MATTVEWRPSRWQLDGQEIDARRIRRGTDDEILYHRDDDDGPICCHYVESIIDMMTGDTIRILTTK